MLIVQALEDSICTALLDVPHPCNTSRLRVNCSSSWHVHRIHPQVVVLLKRVVIAGLLSASLNLLVDQRPTVRNCAETLLHDRLEYVQNIRSLEY
jgi:hypothetical protein